MMLHGRKPRMSLKMFRWAVILICLVSASILSMAQIPMDLHCIDAYVATMMLKAVFIKIL